MENAYIVWIYTISPKHFFVQIIDTLSNFIRNTNSTDETCQRDTIDSKETCTLFKHVKINFNVDNFNYILCLVHDDANSSSEFLEQNQPNVNNILAKFKSRLAIIFPPFIYKINVDIIKSSLSNSHKIVPIYRSSLVYTPPTKDGDIFQRGFLVKITLLPVSSFATLFDKVDCATYAMKCILTNEKFLNCTLVDAKGVDQIFKQTWVCDMAVSRESTKLPLQYGLHVFTNLQDSTRLNSIKQLVPFNINQFNQMMKNQEPTCLKFLIDSCILNFTWENSTLKSITIWPIGVYINATEDASIPSAASGSSITCDYSINFSTEEMPNVYTCPSACRRATIYLVLSDDDDDDDRRRQSKFCLNYCNVPCDVYTYSNEEAMLCHVIQVEPWKNFTIINGFNFESNFAEFMQRVKLYNIDMKSTSFGFRHSHQIEIDCLVFMQKFTKECNMSNLKPDLDSICEELQLSNIAPIQENLIFSFSKREEKKLQKEIVECIRHVIQIMLINNAINFISTTLMLAQQCCANVQDVINNSTVSKRIELFHWYNMPLITRFVSPYRYRRFKSASLGADYIYRKNQHDRGINTSYLGGLVLVPKPGVYTNSACHCIDIVQMFPNIAIEFNLGFGSTFRICGKDWENMDSSAKLLYHVHSGGGDVNDGNDVLVSIKCVQTVVAMNNMNPYSTILKWLCQQRLELKNQRICFQKSIDSDTTHDYKNKASAFRVLEFIGKHYANASYGVTGMGFNSSNITFKTIAECTTFQSRIVLKKSLQLFKGGADDVSDMANVDDFVSSIVLYGDTDSLIFQRFQKDSKNIVAINTLVDKINDFLAYKSVKFALESSYSVFIIGSRKKVYIGYNHNDDLIKICGIPNKNIPIAYRKDTCDILKQYCVFLLKNQFEKVDTSSSVTFVWNNYGYPFFNRALSEYFQKKIKTCKTCSCGGGGDGGCCCNNNQNVFIYTRKLLIPTIQNLLCGNENDDSLIMMDNIDAIISHIYYKMKKGQTNLIVGYILETLKSKYNVDSIKVDDYFFDYNLVETCDESSFTFDINQSNIEKFKHCSYKLCSFVKGLLPDTIGNNKKTINYKCHVETRDTTEMCGKTTKYKTVYVHRQQQQQQQQQQQLSEKQERKSKPTWNVKISSKTWIINENHQMIVLVVQKEDVHGKMYPKFRCHLTMLPMTLKMLTKPTTVGSKVEENIWVNLLPRNDVELLLLWMTLSNSMQISAANIQWCKDLLVENKMGYNLKNNLLVLTNHGVILMFVTAANLNLQKREKEIKIILAEKQISTILSKLKHHQT
jgi:hypothetical protein